MRTKIYTVYEKPELEEPSARVMLVREGFSWLALIFGLLWLLARGLWVASLVYAVALAVLVYLAQYAGMDDDALTLIPLFAQLVLGFVANDLQRESLQRRGYRFTGVVAAESVLAATRRYYDCLAA